MNDYVMMKDADGAILKVAPQFVETFLKCGYIRVENEKQVSHTEEDIEDGINKPEKKQAKKSSGKSGKQN